MAASSLTRHAEVMTRKITFMERWAKEQVARGSNGGLVRAERTRLRFQGGKGCFTGRKTLRSPQRNLEVIG